jgi:hypothetical protein
MLLKFSVKLFVGMRLSKASNHKLKILYILFAIVLAGWLVIVIHNYWQSNAKVIGANNSAELVAVNNGLQNLPKPASIEPGKTSGNLSATISNYLSAQQSIKNSANNLGGDYIFNVGLKAFKLNSTNNSSKATLTEINSNLDRSYNALSITQKIIEYNPGIDLKPLIDGQENGSNERLTRTEQGIIQIIDELNNSNIAYKNDLLAIISPLQPKVMLITPSNVTSWQKEVLEAQKAVIKIINDDFNSSVNTSSSTLTNLSQDYLAI